MAVLAELRIRPLLKARQLLAVQAAGHQQAVE
jgi:hypothetical protein